MRSLIRFSVFGLEAFGACVSGLCLVQCVAMPVIVAFSPTLAHLIPGDERVHRVLAFLVVGAGVPSFLSGTRKHRKYWILGTGCAGMAVVVGALAFADRFSSHLAEIGVTSLGSVLLTTAHLVNRTFCRKCSHCKH